jgi:hypothetical protein
MERSWNLDSALHPFLFSARKQQKREVLLPALPDNYIG